MASSSSNRQASFQSLISFMQEYSFPEVGLDWEHPVDPARGGNSADTEDFVSLVSDMQAAFRGRYGISVTLANIPLFGSVLTRLISRFRLYPTGLLTPLPALNRTNRNKYSRPPKRRLS